jgi:glycosyltransferase involved in cell wall biosynthesis
MKILFIHQNMPAQYAHLAPHFAKSPENEVVFLTKRKDLEIQGVRKVRYELSREPRTDSHQYVRTLDEQLLYGQAVARKVLELRDQGFVPDIICAHSGWGEALFLKELLPDVPLMIYAEFFYRAKGSDMDFATDQAIELDRQLRTRMRNVHLLQGLVDCDWALSPTIWQWQQHPEIFRPKISVLHDGIRTEICKPDPTAELPLPNGKTLTRSDEVITYVARNLEPYRGFDVFSSSLPELMKRRPNAHVVLIGGDEVSYGSAPSDARNWRERALRELPIDPNRVHFMGRVPYSMYMKVLQISRVHVYLTYPFVLSWSMLESMSMGCALVASSTAPVREVMTHRENGLMVDYFNRTELIESICEVLEDADLRKRLGENARRMVIEKFDLNTVCLPKQIELIETLAAGGKPPASTFTPLDSDAPRLTSKQG